MPYKPPRICKCGALTPAGARCTCDRAADAERKARFDEKRPSSSRRGYNGKWERAKSAWLETHTRCRRCGKPATVVDHITPHKGDMALFWDRANWQPLCAPCHNGAKQREERRNLRG